MPTTSSGLPSFQLGHLEMQTEGSHTSYHFYASKGPSDTSSLALAWEEGLKLAFKASGRTQGPRIPEKIALSIPLSWMLHRGSSATLYISLNPQVYSFEKHVML